MITCIDTDMCAAQKKSRALSVSNRLNWSAAVFETVGVGV